MGPTKIDGNLPDQSLHIRAIGRPSSHQKFPCRIESSRNSSSRDHFFSLATDKAVRPSFSSVGSSHHFRLGKLFILRAQIVASIVSMRKLLKAARAKLAVGQKKNSIFLSFAFWS